MAAVSSHPTLSRRVVLRSGAAGIVVAASSGSESAAEGTDGMVFVLVHPAWHGGWCWSRLTPLLRAAGHAVYTPTLTGLGERVHLAAPDIGLATHVEDVVNVLEFEDLRDVILVGNSSGGMVITGVMHRMPERLAQVVYLDAFVPRDGQSVMDLLPPERRQALEELVKAEGQGWLLPRFAANPVEEILRGAWGVTAEEDVDWMLARLRPTPFRHFTDPVQAANPAAANVSRSFVRCRLFANAAFDRHADMARQTAGWRYRELATPHLPYITHPLELADLLLEMAA